MSLISIPFLIFTICLFAAYFAVPAKHQWKILLAGSAFFYICVNPVYIIFIIISIVSTWCLMRKPSRSHFIWTVVINLGLLIIFKYSVNFGVRDLIAPLGISFYTFMTLGYAHDCCTGRITPSDNIWHYALFISYFPQLTQGPVGTYQEMHEQLISPHSFDVGRLKRGCYRIIIGCFKKFVIAGRLAFYVNTVYASPGDYRGLTLIIATIFFLFELYADFSGYMDIVCGISYVLGIKMKENFRRPFLAQTMPEYWRRWHISLNEWFNQHLLIPADMSGWNRALTNALSKLFPRAKKRDLRMLVPIMIVWAFTGIWHGASLTYLGWGLYFGVVLELSLFTAGFFKKLGKKMKWDHDNKFIRALRVVRTFTILWIGEAMFRAERASDIPVIYKNIFTTTRIGFSEIVSAMSPFGNGNQALASVLIIAVLLTAQFVIEFSKEHDEAAFTGHRYIYALAMLVFMALFGVSGEPSFIYQAF